ncbi:MAG: DnaJ domain-containing protein [Bifidobacteriaceae bacterium]|jgi:molecular chaperone DnaJ|nr:DnaJ domain-containing protein [Bifidobacteriaceae bacterium]
MTGQDWFEKDFYRTLGVPKDADEAAIKKAYRHLARKLHPDANPGDKAAEEKFKEVGEAYSVLSDQSQRQQYDAVRAMAGGGARFSAGPGGPGGQGGFEDMFSGMFGGSGGRVRFSTSGGSGGINFDDLLGSFGGAGGPGGFGAPAPQRGRDISASVTLPFRQAAEGSMVSVAAVGRTISARIPAGVKDGAKIRLRGKGEAGSGGAAPGDIILTVQVTPHPVFSLDGPNLRVTVPVTFPEAALGAQIEVPTLDGSRVKVKVPVGTPSGRVLRVKGKGVRTAKDTGDLLVSVQVAVPGKVTGEARQAVESFRDATAREDPRVELFRQAAQ